MTQQNTNTPEPTLFDNLDFIDKIESLISESESNEEEIATFGKQITHRTKIQKSKKLYDRTGHKAALKKLPFFIGMRESCAVA